MKKAAFLALVLLGTVTWTGCKKEKNKDTELKDDWSATYSVTETWMENSKPLSKPAFTMTIENSSITENLVLLNNFANYGAGVTVEATVSGNMLTIPKQTLPNLKDVVGSGTMEEETITIVYTESIGTISIEVTATAVKK